jgi:hypothetical protein
LESQRVRFLVKGYLRGWLNFKYTQRSSRLREDLILHYIEESHYEELLQLKTLMDSALIGGSANKTADMLSAVDKSYRLMLGLKLPDLAAKSKINEIRKVDGTIDPQQMAEWKALLDAAKNPK